ncbi:MAG TPA: hypothetical protein VGO46_15140 [Gemmatimonadaceae bacterium]|jgi:hypothetical protein|nr:hypothetical protein [Gemmatimonadaceae bacterium]
MRLALIAACAACITTSSVQAQIPTSSRYPERVPPTHGLPVHADYDSKYDKTVLKLDPVPLDSTLSLSALVALDGRPVRKEAPGVVLTFWSVAPQKRFASNRAISVRVDDDSAMTIKDVWLTPTPKEGFSEVGMTGMSLPQWLELARAKHASVTVLNHRYELSRQLLDAIRDFASRMAPVAQEP